VLYEYLLNTFGVNTPISIGSIKFEDYSDIWVAKEIAALCNSGEILRYERGIYYIPQKTPFGNSLLAPDKVIEIKYLSDNGESIGFYTGISALHQMGLSTQIPNVLEIRTNNEKSKLRRVKVGSQEIILRRARTQINNRNISVLRLLEVMGSVPSSYFSSERKEIIKKWIGDNGVTRELITQYAPFFPDSSIRGLVESGIIYYAAQ